MNNKIPSYLTTPSTSFIKPPVDTKLQELPFLELDWNDFERLCLRLIRIDTTVEHCQIYGIQGQNQEGIDIYARKAIKDKYSTYQCKRIKSISAGVLKEIVKIFIEGEWSAKSEIFILCTSLKLNSTNIADEYENQVKVLKEIGVQFLKWDSEFLNYYLKDKPLIVYDFFGYEWAKAFCGEEIINQYNFQNRLSPDKVINLRKQLAKFYSIVFNIFDPGVPSFLLSQKPLLIEDRFVLPDILEKEEVFSERKKDKISADNTIYLETDEQNLKDEQKKYNRPNDNFYTQTSANISYAFQNIIEKRKPVDEWLIENERNIILGEPGSGKSMLIRFLIIDLLQESPRLNKFSDKFGCYLPIWLPFALCSKKISNDIDISIKDILKSWFISHNQNELFELVEEALNDERLLLFIDGLDEWSDQLSAKTALDRINIFIDDKNIPVIITSRPYGFTKIECKIKNTQIAHLSPLSIIQQENLSQIWFKAWIKSFSKENISDINLDTKSKKICFEFIKELQKTSSFDELSKIPLLLCILISQKIQNAILPQSRFEAYEKIIENIILNRPQRRKQDALILEKPITNYFDDYRRPYSLIAYAVLKNSSEGLIEKAKAKELICDYFINDYREKKEDAIRKSHETLDISENQIGILVEKSNDELGFFHRTLQEYLAAFHLSNLSFSEQKNIIALNIINPLWREVILCYFYLLKRPDEVGKILEDIRNLDLNENDKYYVNLITYDIIFSKFSCPNIIRNEIAKEAFNDIETHFWQPYKEKILNIILTGLNSPYVENLIKEKIKIWFPKRLFWKDSVFNSFRSWSDKKSVISCLFNALYDEDISDKRSAAKYLALFAKDNEEVEKKCAEMSMKELDLNTRIAAFEALLIGWPKNVIIKEFIKINIKSNIDLLKLFAIKAKISLNIADNNDLEDLIKFLQSSELYIYWIDDVADCLIERWKSTDILKQKCIEKLNISYQHSSKYFGKQYKFLEILIKGFPQDNDVANLIKDVFENEEYPFNISNNIWPWFSKNFANNEIIVPSIEKWITEKDKIHSREMYYLSFVAKTDNIKKKMIELLTDKNSFPHWPAIILLENWGINDIDVSKLFLELIKDDDFASRIGYLLPKIITNKKLCYKRLENILKSDNCNREDFVIEGIIELKIIKDNDPIIDYILDEILIEKKLGILFDKILSILIINFPENERIKNLIINSISDFVNVLPSISFSYNNILKVQNEILSICTPLSESLRNIISVNLNKSYHDKDYVLELLRKYRNEIDPNIKIQTAISYYESLNEYEADFTNDYQKLSEELIKLGPEYPQIRQAALCGSIILQQYELIKNVLKSEQNFSPGLNWDFDRKPTLVKFFLNYWKNIKENIDNNFYYILKIDINHMWSVFSNYIDTYPDVKNDLLQHINTFGVRKYENTLLFFISKNYPKSKFLIDCCLESKDERNFIYGGAILKLDIY